MGAQNVTGAGSSITIMDALYPQGFTIKEGADDAPLIEISNPRIGEYRVGMNGNGIKWNRASTYTITVSVVPNTESDKRLKAIVAYNRIQDGGAVNIDSIQLVVKEGITGEISTFVDVAITEGAIGNTFTTEGRFSTRTYTFEGSIKAS